MILSTDSQLDGENENSWNGSPNTLNPKQTHLRQWNNSQIDQMNNGNDNVTAL